MLASTTVRISQRCARERRIKGVDQVCRFGHVAEMADRSTIDTFASRQYGVFSRRQATEAGYDRHAIQRRVSSSEWIRLGPNVFCVSSAPPKWERKMAAAVLSRPRAVVGGRSAAYLLGIRGFRPGRPTVVVPVGSNARLEIGRVIRSKHFDRLATVQVAGFTVTSVAETLMTLAKDLPLASLEDSFEDALLAGKVRISDFAPIIEREAGAPWAGVMERLVFEHSAGAPSVDSSYLEGLLERLFSKAQLPEWRREFPFSIRGRPGRVDVYFPDWRLAVEADGRTWHGRRRDEEQDRRRDAELAAQGIQVIRLTYTMLTDEPDECLRLVLAAGRHRSAQRVVQRTVVLASKKTRARPRAGPSSRPGRA